jgi:hypothetical protein
MRTEPLPISPIGGVTWRSRVRVRGRVKAIRVQPWNGSPALEITLADETGGLLVIFLGRRSIGGIDLGRIMEVEGMTGSQRGYLAILNPIYELKPAAIHQT